MFSTSDLIRGSQGPAGRRRPQWGLNRKPELGWSGSPAAPAQRSAPEPLPQPFSSGPGSLASTEAGSFLSTVMGRSVRAGDRERDAVRSTRKILIYPSVPRTVTAIYPEKFPSDGRSGVRRGIAIASRHHTAQEPRFGSGEKCLVLDAAYLVLSDRAGEFTAVARALARPHQGMGATLTGPWPPYSFADHDARHTRR
jgi:hypothetical protein